jgi:hypothetical protein
VTKSSHNYVNTNWDLIDAVRANQVDLRQVKKEDLPVNMQGMNAEQRTAYVAAKAGSGRRAQARIHKLNEQRARFVAEELKNRGGQADTLGSAAQQAIREQAAKKNFTFKPAGEPSNTTD